MAFDPEKSAAYMRDLKARRTLARATASTTAVQHRRRAQLIAEGSAETQAHIAASTRNGGPGGHRT